MPTNTVKSLVHIVDTTLRDGEQAPGVAFDIQEKIVIAQMLDKAGVTELEVGIPAMGTSVCQEIKRLVALSLRCLLISWCRAVKSDIERAAECGTEGVHISFPVSPILLQAMGKTPDWVLSRLWATVPRAMEKFRHVYVGAQDAFRADPEFLRAFVQAAAALGVHRLRIADTVGMARPSQVTQMAKKLMPLARSMQLEFHGHNDLGMATANTVAAMETGISAVSVTVNGIGERAGNAPLEQVVMAADTLNHRSVAVDPRALMGICRFVAKATNRPIPKDRPITGDAVFSHESGIHCAALLKNPDTYQPFSPEILGRRDVKLVVGRHSGSTMIRYIMKKAGITLDDEKAERLLCAVRAEAARKREFLSTEELFCLYEKSTHSHGSPDAAP